MVWNVRVHVRFSNFQDGASPALLNLLGTSLLGQKITEVYICPSYLAQTIPTIIKSCGKKCDFTDDSEGSDSSDQPERVESSSLVPKVSASN
jgi:hypothetical protein